MDDYGWTYGTPQTINSWFAEQELINDDENEEYFLSTPSEASTIKHYLTSDQPAHCAAVAITTVNDQRPLQEIYGKGYGRAGIQAIMLGAIIHDLPQTHVKISELVEAVKTLKDEELGLTDEQVKKVAQYRDSIKLGRFWEIVTDCGRGW